MPRFLPDGNRNAIRLTCPSRTSSAIARTRPSEAEFDGAYGVLVGEPSAGVPTILEMVNLTRLDCAVCLRRPMRIGASRATHQSATATPSSALADQP